MKYQLFKAYSTQELISGLNERSDKYDVAHFAVYYHPSTDTEVFVCLLVPLTD